MRNNNIIRGPQRFVYAATLYYPTIDNTTFFYFSSSDNTDDDNDQLATNERHVTLWRYRRDTAARHLDIDGNAKHAYMGPHVCYLRLIDKNRHKSLQRREATSSSTWSLCYPLPFSFGFVYEYAVHVHAYSCARVHMYTRTHVQLYTGTRIRYTYAPAWMSFLQIMHALGRSWLM